MGASKKKNNNSHKSIAKDAGAPRALVTSLLVGIPFLAAIVLHDALNNVQSFYPSFAMVALIVQGLSCCFYWRRIEGSSLKTSVAWLYILTLWFFMIGVAVSSVASRVIVTDIDLVSTVVGVSLCSGGVSGLLFAILWGVQSKGLPRFQVLSLSAFTLILGVTVVASSSYLESYDASEQMTLSAKDFDKDNYNVVYEKINEE